MRIALATWSSRRVGGIEDYLSLLIPALGQAGHDVAVWHEFDEPHDRHPIDHLESAACFSAAGLGIEASIRGLRSWKPDVVYAQGFRDVQAESRVLDVGPAVLFLHTYSGTCISGSKAFSRPALRPCDRRFGPACLVHFFPRGCGGSSPATMWKLYRRESERLRLLGRYRRILTNSHHMRDEMTKHGLRSDVLPFPVAAEAAGGRHRDLEHWHLLFAGRMHYLKGGLLLLEALPRVASAARRPVRVTFAGDGPDRALWEKRARQIVAASPSTLSVDFTGWLARDEVSALMRTADLLVVPSVWPEPLGSVGPAAAQHGLPAAAFAAGGIVDWLADGVSGHLAPADPPTARGLAEAIVRCLDDESHYRDLCAGARTHAARFTMACHLPVLLSVLESAAR